MTLKVSSSANASGDNLGLGDICELCPDMRWIKIDLLLCLTNFESDVILFNDWIEEFGEVVVALE